MAIFYFCEEVTGFVKHMHEQTSPSQESKDKVIQGCVGQYGIVKAYEILPAAVQAELNKLVANGTTDAGTAASILNNFNTRHAADLANIVPQIPKGV